MDTPTLLITGVGSLVGDAILDALEGRRERLRIVGTSFGAVTPNVYRCDEAHLTEHADGPGLVPDLAAVIADVDPDIVIPARDPDVVALAALRAADPSLRAMVGTPAATELFADKLAMVRFAAERGLPAVPGQSAADGPIAVPAVAKPRRGSASLGVRLVLTETQMAASVGDDSVILQPLIGPVPEPPDAIRGWPLFRAFPTTRQGGVQGVLGPDGEVVGAVAFETTHEYGKVTHQRLVEDAALRDLGHQFLMALAEVGWRGPVNMTTIHDGSRWLALELNGRFSGGTAARTAAGFDEVGLALRSWLGEDALPLLPAPVEPLADVHMRPRPIGLPARHVAAFAAEGRWTPDGS